MALELTLHFFHDLWFINTNFIQKGKETLPEASARGTIELRNRAPRLHLHCVESKRWNVTHAFVQHAKCIDWKHLMFDAIHHDFQGMSVRKPIITIAGFARPPRWRCHRRDEAA